MKTFSLKAIIVYIFICILWQQTTTQASKTNASCGTIFTIPQKIQILKDLPSDMIPFGVNSLDVALLFYYKNFGSRYVGKKEFNYYLTRDFKLLNESILYKEEDIVTMLKPGYLIVFDDNYAAVYIGNNQFIDKRGYAQKFPIRTVSLNSIDDVPYPLLPIITRFTRIKIYTFDVTNRKSATISEYSHRIRQQYVNKALTLNKNIYSIVSQLSWGITYFLDNKTVDKAIDLHKEIKNWTGTKWQRVETNCGSYCVETLYQFLSLVEIYPAYLQHYHPEIHQQMQRN